jgi:hypothetical protein
MRPLTPGCNATALLSRRRAGCEPHHHLAARIPAAALRALITREPGLYLRRGSRCSVRLPE